MMTSNSFLKKFHNDGTKILKRYLNAKKFHNNGIKTVVRYIYDSLSDFSYFSDESDEE